MPSYQVGILVTLFRQNDGRFAAAKVVKAKDIAKQMMKFFVFTVLGAYFIRPTTVNWAIICYHSSLFFPNFA